MIHDDSVITFFSFSARLWFNFLTEAIDEDVGKDPPATPMNGKAIMI